MKQLKTITPLEAVREAERTKAEAREILFKDRPDVRDLFDTIEALPIEKQTPVIETLTSWATGEITTAETEARLASTLRG